MYTYLRCGARARCIRVHERFREKQGCKILHKRTAQVSTAVNSTALFLVID